jgi:hypothetical protein
MSSLLKIVCLSSLTIAAAVGLEVGSFESAVGASRQLKVAAPQGTIIAGFTPDPSKPPVETRGTGTR